MATENEHKLQAQHDQDCLDALDKVRFPDWASTIAFYKAVHLVEMLLVKKGLGHKSGSHVKRNHLLKTQFPSLWKDYRPLYAFSRTARYWCMKVKASDFPYVEKRLNRVELGISAIH